MCGAHDIAAAHMLPGTLHNCNAFNAAVNGWTQQRGMQGRLASLLAAVHAVAEPGQPVMPNAETASGA